LQTVDPADEFGGRDRAYGERRDLNDILRCGRGIPDEFAPANLIPVLVANNQSPHDALLRFATRRQWPRLSQEMS
jgi:hypothetical protein